MDCPFIGSVRWQCLQELCDKYKRISDRMSLTVS